MISLSNKTLSQVAAGVAVPQYDRSQLEPGIAHFGVGNFHRTHQAVYIDRILHQGGNEQWGIVGIGLSAGSDAEAKAARFREQDCLYTLTEFGTDGSPQSRVIGSMIDYLHAPSDPNRVLDLLSNPALRIVTLTITEGGYEIDGRTGRFHADEPHIQADVKAELPGTVFGYIVRALERRRAAGIDPFTIVSCDNLRQNGSTVRKAIVGYAEEWDPELASWIAENVSCPNSMVDRIAPYVAPADKDHLNSLTSIDDSIPVMSETYLQWVIQDEFPAGRPALDTVGVQLRPDVELFETVKGRMLNATHVLLSYPSLLLGHRYVHEAMGDPKVRKLLEVFLDIDVIPLLQGPEGVSLTQYKDLILDRFANPAIRDQLIRIATDGASKIPVFHARTIAEQLAAGTDLRREAFLLACYAQYLKGVDDRGATIEVTEPNLGPAEQVSIDGGDGLGLLRTSSFESLGLSEVSAFTREYLGFREQMARAGVAAALDSVVSDSQTNLTHPLA